MFTGGCLIFCGLHRTVAKALNASQGQWENLWAAEPYHSLELAADEDVIDQIGYVAANPTEAGLVESPEEWPGVLLLPGADVRTFTIARPTTYFTDAGAFPDKVTLRITPVAGRRHTNAEMFGRVVVAIQHAVTRGRAAILAGGRTFLGRDAVIGKSFQRRAESFEPRRGPIPQVRARNRTLLRAILAKYGVFRAAYREALAAWRRKDRSVLFPFGTWAMRLFHGASVAAAPG